MSTSTLIKTRVQLAAESSTSDDERKLSYHVLTRPREKIDALNLIADSIAQQRQHASQALIFHPICLAPLAGVLSMVHVASGSARHDLSAMIITYSGIVLAYLLTIRYFTSPYIQIAEEMNWNTWLKGPNGKDDIVLGVRYGTEVIAALVLRLPKGSKEAAIRAWTTTRRYRRRGLGGDMLREAVKLVKERRGRGCNVVFAEDHANSSMPLNSVFNAAFKARDERAARALRSAVEEVEGPSS